MDVHEPGRHDPAARVDLAVAAAGNRADAGDLSPSIATSARTGSTPVPSATSPPRTTMSRAQAALGPVDTLVNNAGANFYGPVLGVRESRNSVMRPRMVRAPFRLCQLAVPAMVERGQGWILNITSKQARHPIGPPYPDWASDGSVPYGMCKAALDRFTTGLAAELHGTGVSVNALGTSAAERDGGRGGPAVHGGRGHGDRPHRLQHGASRTAAPGRTVGAVAHVLSYPERKVYGS
jgi:NAD(P)-dependent dehydrogenase (short-subunit alcohol dehydrogenase family)